MGITKTSFWQKPPLARGPKSYSRPLIEKYYVQYVSNETLQFGDSIFSKLGIFGVFQKIETQIPIAEHDFL